LKKEILLTYTPRKEGEANFNSMERLQRVNQLIKKELSQIILREVDFSKDVLVTVTRVETSRDLNQAKIYVSVMPADKTRAVLQILANLIYELQQRLNKRLKMRPTPRIMFVEERKTREAGRIEEILEKIHKKDA
jgi:ribosome-binding factor A